MGQMQFQVMNFYRLTKSVLRTGGAIGVSYGAVAAGIALVVHVQVRLGYYRWY